MPVQKIKSGRIITVQASTYVGDKGIIFYDEDTPQLRLSDGITPGGIPIIGGGGTGTFVLVTATTTRLGGIKVGANLTIEPDGTLSANTATVGVSDSFNTIKVLNQPDIIAVGADIIEFVAGSGILIETSATSTPYKTMTINSSGVPNLDGGHPDSVYDLSIFADGGSP